MRANVYQFLDSAVGSAMLELSSGRAKVAELKFESGEDILWIVLTNRTTEPLACYTGKTIDQDTLVGIGPTFFVKERDPVTLHSAVCAFLSQQLAGAVSLSAELFTGSGISTAVFMIGDSIGGVMQRVESGVTIRWEPVGPSGFGC